MSEIYPRRHPVGRRRPGRGRAVARHAPAAHHAPDRAAPGAPRHHPAHGQRGDLDAEVRRRSLAFVGIAELLLPGPGDVGGDLPDDPALHRDLPVVPRDDDGALDRAVLLGAPLPRGTTGDQPDGLARLWAQDGHQAARRGLRRCTAGSSPADDDGAATDEQPVTAVRRAVGATSGPPMVLAQRVRKRFGRLEVLRGIDLRVERGTVVCILGRSGSGKSTFLRCVNYLERIDGGRLSVDGDARRVPHRRATSSTS